MSGLVHMERSEKRQPGGAVDVESAGTSRDLRGMSYDSQVQRLAPVQRREAGGSDAAKTDDKESGLKTEAKAELGASADIAPDTIKGWQDEANAKLGDVKKWIKTHAHAAMGTSAPNQIDLDLKLEASASAGSLGAKKGKGVELSGPSASAKAKFTGAIGWRLGLEDCLLLAGESEDALSIDQDFSFAGESGNVKVAPNGELFVGAKVEAEGEVGTADGVGEMLGKFAEIAGLGAADAAKDTSGKATGDIKTKAEGSGDPVPKIARKGAGEGGSKADAKSDDVSLAGGSLKGKAFAGAEITVGAKAALAWKKKEPAEYASALQHYLKLGLALNPATAPFAPAVVALLSSFPDVGEKIAPTLMGAAGDVPVAALEASVTGQAGAGAEGALEAKFAGGKISFSASGEGSIGLGAGAEVKVEADAIEIMRLGAAMQGGLLEELTGAVSEKMDALASRASEIWTIIVDEVSSSASKLGVLLVSLGGAAKELVFSVGTMLINAGVKVKDVLAAIWATSSDAISSAMAFVAEHGKDALEFVWEKVKDSASDAATFLGGVIGSASEYTDDVLDMLWEKSWSFWGDVWGNAGSGLRKSLFAFVKDQGWGDLGSLLSEASDNVKALMSMIWEACRMEDLAAVFHKASARWTRFWDYIWDKASMEQLGRMVDKALGSDIAGWAKAIYDKANIEQIGRFVGKLSDRFWAFLRAIKDSLSAWDYASLL